MIPTVGSMNLNCHQRTQIITEVNVKLNKWHITIENYIENELKQNKIYFLKIMTRQWDRTVKCELKTQHARAIPLHQHATRWKSSKGRYKLW